MKNTFFFMLCFFFYCTIIKAQSNCNQDSVNYLVAYNYIMNDSINQGKSISVSDSIVDIDRFWFSGELRNFTEEQVKLNQYRKNKNFTWFVPFYSSCLATLFPKKDKLAKNVIFFSKIEDNMLLADLLPHTRQFDRFNYDEMAFQTVGRIYLFIFCKEGNLKAAFSREIHYD